MVMAICFCGREPISCASIFILESPLVIWGGGLDWFAGADTDDVLELNQRKASRVSGRFTRCPSGNLSRRTWRKPFFCIEALTASVWAGVAMRSLWPLVMKILVLRKSAPG